MTTPTLKFGHFESNARTQVAFAYAIFGNNCCVFTAVEPASKGSSINHAEYIAMAIAEKEGKSVFELRFYDLQTRTSYGCGFGKYEPGVFEFEQVIFVADRRLLSGFYADAWRLTECPPSVSHTFAQFIDGEPKQSVPRAFEAAWLV